MRAIVSLPGLPPPAGGTPAARRRALARASDDEIAERLCELAKSLRALDAAMYDPLAAAAGLPLAEVIASPFAIRMVAMALERGATTVHGELRRVIHWPKALAGERGTRDPLHGVWDRGVLRLGKYQQFLQDEPFAIHHPDHVSKWGPHELMHRACGFFFRPGCTRWELYLGARLNELLPVFTFYGPEQAMRLDEGAFDRARAGRQLAAKLADAHWLEDEGRALRARAKRAAHLVRESIEHLERELAAIDEEIATGRRIPVPHPVLDGSSDALAYVAGHRARLEATGGAIAALVPAGEDRIEDVRAYREKIERACDELLFGTIELDLAKVPARRRARDLWDFIQRMLQMGGRAARLASRLAPEAGVEIARAMREGSEIHLEEWDDRIQGDLDDLAPVALANGDRVHGEVALEQLADGIASCAPRALELFGDQLEEVLMRFAGDDTILERAPLGERLAQFLHEHDQDRFAELARFESAIAGARRGDDRIEQLCEDVGAIVVDLDRALVVRSEAFTLQRFEHDVAAIHAGGKPGPGPNAYLVGMHRGEVSVVSAPEHVVAALEALAGGPRPAREIVALLAQGKRRKGWPAGGPGWLLELIAAGVLGWTRSIEGAPAGVTSPAKAKAKKKKARAAR